MKVMLIHSNALYECNDAYGQRLIEQGKAVLPKEKTEPPKAETNAKAEKPNKGDGK